MDDFLYNLRKSVEDRSKSGRRYSDSKNKRGDDRRCGMDRRDRKPQKHHNDRRSYSPQNRTMNDIKQLLEKLLGNQAHQRSIDEERLKLETRRTEAMERIADLLGRATGAQVDDGPDVTASTEAGVEPQVAEISEAAQVDESSADTERPTADGRSTTGKRSTAGRRPTAGVRPTAGGLMRSLRAAGKSYEKIAQALEEKGIPTVSGRGRWRGQTVKRELAKLGVDG